MDYAKDTEFPSNALSNNMDYAKDELLLEQYIDLDGLR